MSDPEQPRTPRRPAPYKTEWSPRPLPQPAPERRRADPVTPTLKELTERERQRAPLGDRNTTAVDGNTSVPESPPHPSVRPSNPCRTQGRLTDGGAAAVFTGGMRNLQSQWASLDETQKRAGLRRLINAPLRSSGMPEVAVASAVLEGDRTGLFDAPNWTLQAQKRLIDSKQLNETDGLDLAKTAWHEARHAEQYYLAARRETASERDALALFHSTGVSDEAMRAALADPVLGAGPDVTRLAPAGYPDTHPAALGICADAMRRALIENRDVRKAMIDHLDATGAARRTAPAGRARDAADRAYAATVSTYTALPEERDAFDVEPYVAQAWSIMHPREVGSIHFPPP